MNSTEDRPRRKRRLLFISAAALLLIIIETTAWILKTNEIISNLGAVFTILGVLLTVFLAFFHDYPPSAHSISASPPTLITNQQEQENSYTKIEGITSATLGLSRGRGALIVYTNNRLLRSPINLTFGFNGSGLKQPDRVERVVRRRTNGRAVFVAIFRELPACSYTVWSDTLEFEEKVNIHAGGVKEVDWRHRMYKSATYQQQTDISPVRSNNEA